MDDVLEALRAPGAGGEERREAIRYLSGRRGQMRYDEYLARSQLIGSGRVEAACKTVVGRRLEKHRNALVRRRREPRVRCARLSGWFDDYWDDRIRRAA